VQLEKVYKYGHMSEYGDQQHRKGEEVLPVHPCTFVAFPRADPRS
jgi:hypothetical protein